MSWGQNFQGWTEIQGGGQASTAPAAATIGDYLFVAVTGPDGHVYLNQGQLGQPFIGWGKIGGQFHVVTDGTLRVR